jgi:hypothetical protein
MSGLTLLSAFRQFLISSRSETALTPDNSTSPWLAGLRTDSFPGSSLDIQIAHAAHSISADILSPYSHVEKPTANPAVVEYVPFTTKEMIDEAHRLGLVVKPFTVCYRFLFECSR